MTTVTIVRVPRRCIPQDVVGAFYPYSTYAVPPFLQVNRPAQELLVHSPISQKRARKQIVFVVRVDRDPKSLDVRFRRCQPFAKAMKLSFKCAPSLFGLRKRARENRYRPRRPTFDRALTKRCPPCMVRTVHEKFKWPASIGIRCRIKIWYVKFRIGSHRRLHALESLLRTLVLCVVRKLRSLFRIPPQMSIVLMEGRYKFLYKIRKSPEGDDVVHRLRLWPLFERFDLLWVDLPNPVAKNKAQKFDLELPPSAFRQLELHLVFASFLQKDFTVNDMPFDNGVVVVALVALRRDTHVVHKDRHELLAGLVSQLTKSRVHEPLKQPWPLLRSEEKNRRPENATPANQLKNLRSLFVDLELSEPPHQIQRGMYRASLRLFQNCRRVRTRPHRVVRLGVRIPVIPYWPSEERLALLVHHEAWATPASCLSVR